MGNDLKQKETFKNDKIAEYHCPRYEELPSIELYMEQTVSLLDSYLAPFEIPGEEKTITPTMINNYVKQKIIHPPKNKKYNKSHLMYLIVVGILKNVLSISDIAELIKMQTEQYPLRKAFNFFALELENALKVTFVSRDFSEANSARERTQLSKTVRSALLSFSNNVYVKQNIYLRRKLRAEKELKTQEKL